MISMQYLDLLPDSLLISISKYIKPYLQPVICKYCENNDQIIFHNILVLRLNPLALHVYYKNYFDDKSHILINCNYVIFQEYICQIFSRFYRINFYKNLDGKGEIILKSKWNKRIILYF